MIQLQSIRIENIGPHADTFIEFAPMNIIKGKNRNGKTAVHDALKLCLTGKARGMKAKKDHARMIKTGADKGKVTLKGLVGNEHVTIVRAITPSNVKVSYTEVSGGTMTGSSAQDMIYRALGMTEQLTEAYFDAFALPKMDATARKGLLQRLVFTGGSEALRKYIVDQGHELPDTIMQQIIDAFEKDGLGSDTKGGYGVAVTRRRALKKELKDLNEEKEPEIDSDLKGTTRDEMQASLSRLMVEKSELEADYDPVKGERTALESQITEINTSIDDAATEVKRLEALGLSSIVDKAQKFFDLADEKLAQTANPSYEGVAGELERAKLTLQQHVPKASKTTIGEIDKAIKNDNQASIDSDEHQEAYKVAQTDKAAAATKLSEAKSALKKQESTVASLDAFESALREANTKLKNLPEEVPADEQQKATQMEQIKERIEKSENSMTTVINYQNWLKNQESVVKRRKALQSGINSWDDICDDLNPKSKDLTKLFGGDFDALHKHILQLSTALEIPAKLQPDFEIEIQSELTGEHWIPLSDGSESEKYAVGIATLFALATMQSVGFISVDFGDILQHEAKNALLKALQIISSRGLQVMMYATAEPTTMVNTPEMKVISIERGAVYDG